MLLKLINCRLTNRQTDQPTGIPPYRAAIEANNMTTTTTTTATTVTTTAETTMTTIGFYLCKQYASETRQLQTDQPTDRPTDIATYRAAISSANNMTTTTTTTTTVTTTTVTTTSVTTTTTTYTIETVLIMTISTRGYGQINRQTNRPTLLPIELLSQLKIARNCKNLSF